MHVQYNQKTFNLLRINILSKYIFKKKLAKAPARFQLMTYREVALLGKKFEKENMFKIILDFIGGRGVSIRFTSQYGGFPYHFKME